MLIAISGKARSGKDTFSQFLIEAFKNKYNEVYKKYAYADSLKNKLMLDFDLSHEQLYGDIKEVPDSRYKKLDGTFWTPREIMQFIGTDCYRAIDDNFWVNSLFKIIDTNNAIISDCRFKSEIDAVVNRGGYHIRIMRDGPNNIHGEDHISETELSNDYRVDIGCLNNGTLEKLKDTAYETIELLINLEKRRYYEN